LNKGKAGSALNSGQTSQVVFRVKEIVPAVAPTDAERAALSEQLQADLSNQALTEYTEALKSDYGVSVNEDALKRSLGVAVDQ
jgi:peptidyl-prolyl cis-trans isomerase D